jgi:hypothetical protein
MKTQTIRSVFENALKNERHDKNSETRYWCGQYRLMAKWAIEQLEQQAIAQAEKQEPVASGIEAKVCEDIVKRQQLGLAKYGMSVADNPALFRVWLQHAYEECLDQAVYLKKAIELHDQAL